MNQQPPELFRRHKLSPILTAADWPYPVHTVFNPAARMLPDGVTLLLCRVEDRRGLSHLCVARSANGVDEWQIDPQPTFLPDPEHFPEELWDIEDPHITFMPELSQYAVTSVARPWPGRKVAVGCRARYTRCTYIPARIRPVAAFPVAGPMRVSVAPNSPSAAERWHAKRSARCKPC
jgi:predicted GH43/DUF377 family glycosyl hydrolase